MEEVSCDGWRWLLRKFVGKAAGGVDVDVNKEVEPESCGARRGSEDENASSSGSREGNVCTNALHVIGLHGSGDKISLFLQD